MFCAPECKIQSSICLKTDIWDLGVVFFKILTGINIKHEKYYNPAKQSIIEYMKTAWKELKEKREFLTD